MVSLPLISIVIPCYNTGVYVERAIRSIWDQHFDDYEIVLVDDGSTDETRLILHGLAGTDPRITTVYQTNQGVSAARNAGTAAANGQYICYLDSDDLLSEGTLSYWSEQFHKYPDADVLCFGYQAQTVETGRIRVYQAPTYHKTLLHGTQLLKLFLERKIHTHIGAFIVRKKLLQRYDLSFLVGCKIGEDIRFIIQMLQHARLSYYDSRICFCYLIRHDSVMQGYQTVNIGDFSYLEAINGLCINCPELQWVDNLFVGVSYLSLLVRYLRFATPDREVERLFSEYHNMLYKPLRSFSVHHALIYLFRLIPMSLLFGCKHIIHRH